jgi:exopolyphosphatase/guanosine-5'-triphosphate,3'-diphosphate pyrophosphatase
VARYHRKALPDPEHEDLKGISPADRVRVEWMAACLRIADGLDRRHLQEVRDLSVRFEGRRIELQVCAPGPIDAEVAAADKKSDLLRRLLDRPLDLVPTATDDDAEPCR